ncbi:hypothetical protein D3C87_856140 [compost metagenome]
MNSNRSRKVVKSLLNKHEQFEKVSKAGIAIIHFKDGQTKYGIWYVTTLSSKPVTYIVTPSYGFESVSLHSLKRSRNVDLVELYSLKDYTLEPILREATALSFLNNRNIDNEKVFITNILRDLDVDNIHGNRLDAMRRIVSPEDDIDPNIPLGFQIENKIAHLEDMFSGRSNVGTWTDNLKQILSSMFINLNMVNE